MALHRRMPHAKEPALVRRLAGLCQRVIRATRTRTRTRALSVAVIVPLVLVAVGAAAPRLSAPTAGVRGAAVIPVAAVTATGSGPSGPVVVAVEHPPSSVHIAAAAIVAPSPALASPAATVNSADVPGIPAIALSAYRNAEQVVATSDPGCGISWNLLAGIGRIESMHANRGATDARGTPVHPIYGPTLDGTLPGNEVIVQSSAANEVTYVRAMGPMQFLPGTWARYAADGDGDGVADPQSLYDSTLAAARYLCSGGLNLRDQSQVLSAVLRYNNSMPYARNVLGWASAYATGVVPIDLPPITGPPPPIGDMHLENPEGLGPGLPLNSHGLPSTDPLAQIPLIDFGPSGDTPAADTADPVADSDGPAASPAADTPAAPGPTPGTTG